ncbi:hypothetical protein T484DRAFT_2022011, partial [Baffinella frigidus]
MALVPGVVPGAQHEGAIEPLVAQLEGGGWTQDRGYELLLAITTVARSGAGGALKDIALRDRVVAALCNLCKQQLGPPLRRRLAEAMCALIDAEGRAVLPIVDGVILILETITALASGKTATVAAGGGARVTGLACLERVLAHIGYQASSRLPALLAICRAAVKPGEAPQVRVRGARALIAGIGASEQAGRGSHEECLKLVKTLLADKMGAVRLASADLLLAVVQAAPQPHELYAEKLLTILAASLDTPGSGSMGGVPAEVSGGDEGARAEARCFASVLGKALGVLALADPPPPEPSARVKMSGFRKRKHIIGVDGALAFLRAAFLAARPASEARVSLARALRALIGTIARSAGEVEVTTAGVVGVVLDLAVSSGGKAPFFAARHTACCVGEALGTARAFSEEAQQQLARTLLAEIATRTREPASRDIPGQALAVTCAVHELTRVLLDLSGTPPDPEHLALLLPLLDSPFAPLRAAAAVAVRALVSAAPALTVPAMRALLDVLHSDAAAHADATSEHTHGACLAIASVMMSARTHTHGLPCELLDSVMSLAHILVRMSSG